MKWEVDRHPFERRAAGKVLSAMIKTLEAITEVIRNPRPSFRQVDDRPQKAKKHRYERRKIKEIIRLGDWAQENPA